MFGARPHGRSVRRTVAKRRVSTRACRLHNRVTARPVTAVAAERNDPGGFLVTCRAGVCVRAKGKRTRYVPRAVAVHGQHDVGGRTENGRVGTRQRRRNDRHRHRRRHGGAEQRRGTAEGRHGRETPDDRAAGPDRGRRSGEWPSGRTGGDIAPNAEFRGNRRVVERLK